MWSWDNVRLRAYLSIVPQESQQYDPGTCPPRLLEADVGALQTVRESITCSGGQYAGSRIDSSGT